MELMKQPQPTERNYLEAWLYGWSVLLLAIAATLAIVGATLWACGDDALPLLLAAVPLAIALVLRLFARMARDVSVNVSYRDKPLN
jgi:hypothetical protein